MVMPVETPTQSHRELELLDALRRLGGSARSAELAKSLDVSEETIRRVIKSLAGAGLVERVHGGAYLTGGQNDPSFITRITQNPQEKRRAAECAATLVENGMTVFLDVGSTTAFVAEELQQKSNLTVVTNSLGVAQSLIGHNNNRVHFLGGELHSNERGTFGFVTERQARRFAFDVSFLSADALSSKRGFLYLNPSEASLTEVVLDSSEITAVVLDHHKFGALAPHCGVDPTRITHVATDLCPEGELADALSSWGIEVLSP